MKLMTKELTQIQKQQIATNMYQLPHFFKSEWERLVKEFVSDYYDEYSYNTEDAVYELVVGIDPDSHTWEFQKIIRINQIDKNSYHSHPHIIFESCKDLIYRFVIQTPQICYIKSKSKMESILNQDYPQISKQFKKMLHYDNKNLNAWVYNRISWNEFIEANDKTEINKISFIDLEVLTTRQTALLLDHTDWTVTDFAIVSLATSIKQPYILQDLMIKAGIAKD